MLSDTGKLWRLTASHLLDLPNAGPSTLLDFAVVCEAHAMDGAEQEDSPFGQLLQADLEELTVLFPIDTISPQDPRLNELGLAGESLLVALQHRFSTARSAEAVSSGREFVRRVRMLLETLSRERLDESLDRLIVNAVRHHGNAVKLRLGWDGSGGGTLQEGADDAGVTRERIRQLESALGNKLAPVTYMPALDRAIGLLDEAASRLEADAAGLLMREGISRIPFLPHGVATAADILGKPHAFVVGRDERSVELPGDNLLQPLTAAFRSLTDVNHVAPLAELQARARQFDSTEDIPVETVRSFLNRMPGTVWLDKEHNWLWDSRECRYLNMTRKILAVAGVVSLETLRNGVLRHHRTRKMLLPRAAFEGLCRAWGFVIDAGGIRSSEPLLPDEVLGSIELTIYRILRGEGNALRSNDLRNACVAAGVNRSSFFVYLSYSPILIRLAPAVYGLRGLEIDPAYIAHLAGRIPTRRRALQDHGWTKDGAIWLGYDVTTALYDSGVVFLPSAIRHLIGDARFELYTADGTAMGHFVVRTDTGNAWGLTPFINRRGVDIGDSLIVALDTGLLVAVVQAGAEDLAGTYEDGDGWGPKHFLEEATSPLELD